MSRGQVGRSERQLVILNHLRKLGAAGMSLDEGQAALGLRRNNLVALLNNYFNRGGLVVKTGGRENRRFYLAEFAPEGAISAPVTRADKPSHSGERPFVNKPAPLVVEVSYALNCKITRAPSLNYDPRYQVDPDRFVWGAGFVAAGVGRDVNTGKPWSSSTAA